MTRVKPVQIAAGVSIAITILGVYAYLSNDFKDMEQRQDEKIRLVFNAAGVPPGQEARVRKVLFQQSGDCARLGTELEKSCQDARDMLQIKYGERTVLSYDNSIDIGGAFYKAGGPAGRDGLIREVLFSQSGDCELLNSELQEPCAATRQALKINYGPRPVLSWDGQ